MLVAPETRSAMSYSSHDRQILRELAERYAAHAAKPIQQERKQAWRDHNALRPGRPRVIIDVESPMWREICPPDQLHCQDEQARRHENELRWFLFQAEQLHSDWAILDRYFLPLQIHDSGWGLEVKETRVEHDFGAAHFDPVIVELSDAEKLRTPQVTIDWEASRLEREALQDVFGDILPVESRGYFVPWFSPFDLFAQWRGIEELYFDMMDEPEWLHETLQRITDGYLGMLEQFEQQEALWLNAGGHFVGSGGQGFSDQLPEPGQLDGPVRTEHLWGQATAQIFSEVSPAQHEEFSLPYDQQWLRRFGLGCYGCCEPLHNKIDLLRQIPNLRRLSLSPWAKLDIAASNIGRDYIASVKPNPTVFAAERFDEAGLRAWFQQALTDTAGCCVEFIMKDTCTCRNDPTRPVRWAQIAMEEVERFAAAQC
jgi:hypothetical protein